MESRCLFVYTVVHHLLFDAVCSNAGIVTKNVECLGTASGIHALITECMRISRQSSSMLIVLVTMRCTWFDHLIPGDLCLETQTS